MSLTNRVSRVIIALSAPSRTAEMPPRARAGVQGTRTKKRENGLKRNLLTSPEGAWGTALYHSGDASSAQGSAGLEWYSIFSAGEGRPGGNRELVPVNSC